MTLLEDNILSDFAPISLEEMAQVRLMNRTDTKFVTTMPRLLMLLEMIHAEYRIQEIDGMRNMSYYTCYFDTPDCDMFAQHQRGRKKRQKIRLRMYEDSEQAFLEIKNKNNRGRTNKRRIPVDNVEENIVKYSDFIYSHSRYEPGALLPQIQNHFHRVTLVNHRMTERLTIDTGLNFHNIPTEHDYSLERIVIIELKRDGNTYSPSLEALRKLHIHPSGFSKYCMGMALTNSELRQNLLKPRLRLVRHLTHQAYLY